MNEESAMINDQTDSINDMIQSKNRTIEEQNKTIEEQRQIIKFYLGEGESTFPEEDEYHQLVNIEPSNRTQEQVHRLVRLARILSKRVELFYEYKRNMPVPDIDEYGL